MRRKIILRDPPAENPVPRLVDFVLQIPAMVREADTRRLSVLLEQVEIEFPDFYHFIASLVDLRPAEVKDRIIERWPTLAILKLHPDADRIITAVQSEIKVRRNHDT